MSWNQEFAVWKNQDNQWFMGLYDSYVGCNHAYDDEDHDEEWCVEWDHGAFVQIWGPAPTEEAVRKLWPHANPGHSGELYEWSGNADDNEWVENCEKLRLTLKG